MADSSNETPEMQEDSEPPIREFADRGTLWLLGLPENLHGLVRLLAEDIAEQLDFSRAQRLNRSFIPDDLHKQEADLLYRVPFRTGKGEVWVYVLLEHQSRPDKTMGLRLLSYMVQLWDAQVREWADKKTPPSQRKLTPILPIVFYTGKRRWKTPLSLNALMEVPPLLQKFVPTFETLFLKLQETQAETLSGSAVAATLRALQVSEEPKEVLVQVLESVVDYLKTLPESSHAEWRKAMKYLYLLIRHKREEAEQEELFEVLDEALEPRNEESEGIRMTGAQALEAKGRKEGRDEGRREVILEQLAFKFGPLSEKTVAMVNALTSKQLLSIGKQVIDAKTLADLKLQ